MMHKICCESEAAMFHRVVFDELRLLTPKPTETLLTAAIAAVDAAFSQNAAAIMYYWKVLTCEFILKLLEIILYMCVCTIVQYI